MRVTVVRAGRIYNWVRELWMPKDLDWVPSVKAAPVRTGKLTTWIRDALVAASYTLYIFWAGDTYIFYSFRETVMNMRGCVRFKASPQGTVIAEVSRLLW